MKEIGFRKIIEIFTYNLEALREYVPVTMSIAQTQQFIADREHLAFLEKYGELEEHTDTSKRFKLEPKYYGKAAEYKRKNERRQKALKLLPRRYLIAYVSEFDALVGRLIREIFILNPSLLNKSEKSLTFSEISNFENIENAREYVLEKEVEAVMRKNHSEHFSWLENKLGLELRKGLDSWRCFIEITERRNLFVHTNGEVSSQYLKVCKSNNVELNSGVQVGSTLDAPSDYLEKAFVCLYEIGVKLAH